MTREQIEKKAKEFCKQDVYGCNECCDECVQEIEKQKMIDLANWALFNQWVSVEDELPKKSEPVLIRNKNGSIARATYSTVGRFDTGNIIEDINAWILIDVGVRVGDSDVTHWMPIPPLTVEGGVE